MKRIRSGMGLGDSLYLQSVVRHFVERDQQRLQVCSNWPDVFRPLGERVVVTPFTRFGIDILAHYSLRKRYASTQFVDCCIQAGITEPVDLRIDWVQTNSKLVERLRGCRRPIVCVQLPRAPMGRTDGFGMELLPDCHTIQTAIDALRDRAVIVQIGAGKPLYRFTGIDIDLANETTVAELLDVASMASAFLGYVSFLVPLAESLNKPALLVWSKRGAKARHEFIRQITPQKVLHKASSRYVMDDAPAPQIIEAAHALLCS